MARSKVDLDRQMGRYRRICSGFVEHPGRWIYGGIYEEGFRSAMSRVFVKT